MQETKDVAIQNNTHQSTEVYIPTQEEWNFMVAWGKQAITTGMLPSSIKSGEAAAIIVLKGRELGASFMTSISHIHVINGKPTMSAELMQATARRFLPGIKIVPVETNIDKATVKILRPEKDSEWFTLSFSIEDAKKADLLKNPTWQKYPRAMLWSRAVSAALRIACPEALMGVSYTPEEMGADVNEAGDVVETTGRKIENEKKNDEPKSITQEQRKELYLLTKDHFTSEEISAELKNNYGVENSSQLTPADFLDFKKNILIEIEKRKKVSSKQPEHQTPPWEANVNAHVESQTEDPRLVK